MTENVYVLSFLHIALVQLVCGGEIFWNEMDISRLVGFSSHSICQRSKLFGKLFSIGWVLMISRSTWITFLSVFICIQHLGLQHTWTNVCNKSNKTFKKCIMCQFYCDCGKGICNHDICRSVFTFLCLL